MDRAQFQPKSQENAWLWLVKAITGLMVMIVLIIHFVVNHFAAPQGLLTYADVVKYYHLPVIPVMEIGFLVFVVSHALIGLRGILLDLKPKPGFLRLVNWVFSIIGVGAITYGSWLIITIAERGAL
jgi:succinate dehydrogenase hydrophobic anchor subunit